MYTKTTGKAKSDESAVQEADPREAAQADPSAEDDGRNGHKPEVLASFSTDVYSDGGVQATATYPPGKLSTYALTEMYGRLLRAAGIPDRDPVL